MLHIVGLGLDDGEITQKGMEALESSEKIYAEFYTNTETVDLGKLEEETGKEIEKLPRSKVEREDIVSESAKEQETCFLVSGDPLTATTHYDIKYRLENQEVEVNVVHAPSIFTSIAETGLNVYKFGRTVTLPRESRPESVTDYIETNLENGLHSLILLDIDYPAGKALEKLADMNPELKDERFVVLERANLDSMDVSVGSYDELSEKEYGDTPHSIMIVGETDHMEEEFLG
jgi:diphthine synthase